MCFQLGYGIICIFFYGDVTIATVLCFGPPQRKKLVLEKVDENGGSKSVKQLEEKVKQLRKKNAELVTLAKNVDDKYKALKLENEQLVCVCGCGCMHVCVHVCVCSYH